VTIRNLTEVNAALAPYISQAAQVTDTQLKLDRISRVLEALGNPERNLRVIHVAGTSGKTSTSYYISALLKAAGKKTGLTVSPHVDGVNERVQIGGRPMPEALFCRELGKFLDIVDGIGQTLTYFELITAFAFWTFERQHVDYAVIETGLGGMYDATNVLRRRDKVCVITDIGLDHMNVLGNTISKIAAQKAGIIHDGNDAFMYKQSGEIMRAVRRRVSSHHARLHVLDEDAERRVWHKELDGIAAYQQRNWLLAYSTYRHLEKRDGLPALAEKDLKRSQAVGVPGRMEVRKIGGKTVIMDGAHNGQKMTAFINSFQRLYPGAKPAVLMSLRDTKDYDDLVTLMLPFAGRIITTSFNVAQDAQIQSVDAEELARAFRDEGMPDVEVLADYGDALRTLLESPEEVCLITGSFYLLNQIRGARLI
jgi:dihydrofolate synthase/folylpolyglutamate synthase